MEKQKKNPLWLNSLCCRGLWLHDYDITEMLDNGVIEVCKRCRKRIYFPNNTPNYQYLSHHLKQALQSNNIRYLRENNLK